MSGNNSPEKSNNNLLAEDLDHILLHAGHILEHFRDGRVFITGGTGFFGTWLLESLAWANLKLHLNVHAVILSRYPAQFEQKAPHLYHASNFTFISGDVRDFAFPTGSFSHIFHFATEASDALNRNHPRTMFEVIVEGTRRTFDFAAKSGVKKILLASSGAVYGKQPYHFSHIAEDYLGGPDVSSVLSAYGEGKRVSELLAAIYSKEYGMEMKIARCFAFVGPYLPLDKHYAIGNFILNVLREEPILIKGDGTPLRSYLYASDMVIWLLTIMTKGQNCRPYNVGSEDSLSILELAKEIIKLSDSGVKVKKLQSPDPSIPPERYVPHTGRARNELGLTQTILFNKAINKTYSFNKKRQENL